MDTGGSQTVTNGNNNNMEYIETQDGGSKNMQQINNMEDKRRKLVINFDIRNTVLVADSVTNDSMEQALNSFLTGVVWGEELSKGMWAWESYKPSLKPPSPNTMTYYKYLEKQLVKTPQDRAYMRIVTGDFTQEKIGESFQPYFESHLKKLLWDHPSDSNRNYDKMTMAGKDGKEYHYLLKSVYRVIHHLHETGRDFAIVFRTYGLDAPNVISSLAQGILGNHPDFPKPLDVKVNYIPGFVQRKPGESIVFEELTSNKDNDKDVDMQQFEGDRCVYDMLCQKKGISGFKDDFIYWQNNDYHYQAGKPLYIDPYDDNVQHIFFDDNLRTFEDDSIINVRLFDKKGCENAKSLTKTEAAKFENVCMVQADLLEAITDQEYYVKAIKTCEDNYNEFLQRYHVDHPC